MRRDGGSCRKSAMAAADPAFQDGGRTWIPGPGAASQVRNRRQWPLPSRKAAPSSLQGGVVQVCRSQVALGAFGEGVWNGTAQY